MDLDSFRAGLPSLSTPFPISYVLVALFLLLNLKSLPLVFHFRCFKPLVKHLYFSSPSQKWKPQSTGPAALFQPVITTTYAPLLELDYNVHKSSSTYFTDMDSSRLHLLACLLHPGIKTLQNPKVPVYGPDGKKVKGGFGFVLGAAQCSYRREIKPFESYEVWSRVLAWDRKWLYVVTHFVKKGAARPKGYTLTNGSLFGGTKGKKEKKSLKASAAATNGAATNGEAKDAATAPPLPHKAICASAISKYVFKKGRLTLHPEVMLEASGLLPHRPGGWNVFPGLRPSTEAKGEEPNGSAKMSNGGVTTSEWDWRMIEEENKRGLKMAEHFAALEGLHEEFTGEEREALGLYADLIW